MTMNQYIPINVCSKSFSLGRKSREKVTKFSGEEKYQGEKLKEIESERERKRRERERERRKSEGEKERNQGERKEGKRKSG